MFVGSFSQVMMRTTLRDVVHWTMSSPPAGASLIDIFTGDDEMRTTGHWRDVVQHHQVLSVSCHSQWQQPVTYHTHANHSKGSVVHLCTQRRSHCLACVLGTASKWCPHICGTLYNVHLCTKISPCMCFRNNKQASGAHKLPCCCCSGMPTVSSLEREHCPH